MALVSGTYHGHGFMHAGISKYSNRRVKPNLFKCMSKMTKL